MILWMCLISAGSTLVVLLRRRNVAGPRYLFCVLAVGGLAVAGLLEPAWERPAVWAAGVGLLLFLLLPGVLVHAGRSVAARGRFRIAAGLLGAARMILPAEFPKGERALYATLAAGGEETAAARAGIEARLRSMSPPAGSVRAATGIVVAIALVHVAVAIYGETTSVLTMLEAGANFRPLVLDGGWHRLLTATLLHAGVVHLVLNAIGIWLFGRWLEPVIGASRTLTVFLLGGLAGNLASFFWYASAEEPVISVGASGGALAMVGCAVPVLWRSAPGPVRNARLRTVLLIIGATVFLGAVSRMIDNGAHLGGLAAGAALGLVFARGAGRRPVVARLLAVLLVGVTLVSVARAAAGIPSWRRTETLETETFTLRHPAFLEAERAGTWWLLAGGPLDRGDLSVQLARGDAESLARTRLSGMLGEARRRDGTVRGDGIERLSAPDGWEAWGLTLANGAGAERREIYVSRDRRRGKAAILAFGLPEDDPEFRRRIVDLVVRSFRFR